MKFMQRFMAGRYGSDQLNVFFLVVYLVISLISMITGLGVLEIIGLALIVYVLFRMFSRNIDRRREENARFLKLTRPVTQWFQLHRDMYRDKDHRYFKCPNCGQRLRVPKGKGKITVTCRACGTSFQEKS